MKFKFSIFKRRTCKKKSISKEKIENRVVLEFRKLLTDSNIKRTAALKPISTRSDKETRTTRASSVGSSISSSDWSRSALQALFLFCIRYPQQSWHLFSPSLHQAELRRNARSGFSFLFCSFARIYSGHAFGQCFSSGDCMNACYFKGDYEMNKKERGFWPLSFLLLLFFHSSIVNGKKHPTVQLW